MYVNSWLNLYASIQLRNEVVGYLRGLRDN
jgi:hypothetical protein